jgi:hypothetical protein
MVQLGGKVLYNILTNFGIYRNLLKLIKLYFHEMCNRVCTGYLFDAFPVYCVLIPKLT